MQKQQETIATENHFKKKQTQKWTTKTNLNMIQTTETHLKHSESTKYEVKQPETNKHNSLKRDQYKTKETKTKRNNKIDNLYQTKNNFERTKVQWNNKRTQVEEVVNFENVQKNRIIKQPNQFATTWNQNNLLKPRKTKWNKHKHKNNQTSQQEPWPSHTTQTTRKEFVKTWDNLRQSSQLRKIEAKLKHTNTNSHKLTTSFNIRTHQKTTQRSQATKQNQQPKRNQKQSKNHPIKKKQFDNNQKIQTQPKNIL